MRCAPIPYSVAEMVWLEVNRTMVISDYHREFARQFGRSDVTSVHLHGLRKRKGWKVGRDGSRYRGRIRLFSVAEIAWLSDQRALPIAEYYEAYQSNFSRPDVTPQKLHALRKRQGWKTGRTGQYQAGSAPLNKGKKCELGTGGLHPNARKTQFPKGGRTGNAALNYKPIGAEREYKGGYLQRKIHDDLPMQSRWKFIHQINWEVVNGPLPKGFALKCLDGDRKNTAATNWEAIPRGVLARLNGGRFRTTLPYDQAPDELKPVVMAVAKLRHRAAERRSAAA